MDFISGFDIEPGKAVKAVEGKLFEIGQKSTNPGAKAIITGYIRNVRTGEPVTSASVFTDSVHATLTDLYGHYSLTLPVGNRVLNVQTVGMKDIKLQLLVHSNGSLDVWDGRPN